MKRDFLSIIQIEEKTGIEMKQDWESVDFFLKLSAGYMKIDYIALFCISENFRNKEFIYHIIAQNNT